MKVKATKSCTPEKTAAFQHPARERRSLKRQERPVAAGTVLANTQMVGVGMARSSTAIIRETRRGQAAFMAERPEETARRESERP